MRVTPTHLRANLYQILDQVIETGEAVEIDRKGVVLLLQPPGRADWLDRLPRREGVVNGDPEGLVHIDWSSHWDPGPT